MSQSQAPMWNTGRVVVSLTVGLLCVSALLSSSSARGSHGCPKITGVVSAMPGETTVQTVPEPSPSLSSEGSLRRQPGLFGSLFTAIITIGGLVLVERWRRKAQAEQRQRDQIKAAGDFHEQMVLRYLERVIKNRDRFLLVLIMTAAVAASLHVTGFTGTSGTVVGAATVAVLWWYVSVYCRQLHRIVHLSAPS